MNITFPNFRILCLKDGGFLDINPHTETLRGPGIFTGIVLRTTKKEMHHGTM